MKRCSKCGAERGESTSSWCKKCKAEHEANKRRERGIKPRTFSKIEGDKKLCMKCKEMKSLSEFSPSLRGLGNVSAYCRLCQNKRPRNTEAERKATARYREKHRERWLALHRVHQFERKHRIKITSDGSVTDGFLKELYATENCYYCGEVVPRDKRTAEHKLPLIRGGAHSADNMVMACEGCNFSKQDKTEEEFKRFRNDRS